jgi:hypothetical protein
VIEEIAKDTIQKRQRAGEVPPPLWTPDKPQSPLFRKIAEQAKGWQQQPLTPLVVGSGGLVTSPNVSYVEPVTPSSTYSASALLNKPNG